MEKQTYGVPVLNQNVTASLAVDGSSASVRFSDAGKLYEFELSLFSVYSADAEAVAHTDDGPEELDTQAARTFRSRVDGKWASATLHEDGSVSGIFEDSDGLIEVRPLDGSESPETASLLAMSQGQGLAHAVWRREFPDLTLASLPTHLESALLEGKSGSLIQQARDRPRKSIDIHSIDEDGKHHGFEVPPGADEPHDEYRSVRSNDPRKAGRKIQGRTKAARSVSKWWPGCYSGDSDTHKFVVGVMADEPMYKFLGSKTQSKLESYVSEASYVYEKQMNIRLEVGSLKMYKSTSGAPSYAVGCGPGKKPKSGKFMDDKLEGLTKGVDRGQEKWEGAVHLFTGCGDGFGVVGLAWTGFVCDREGFSTATNQAKTEGVWLTFAHELGHNFNADHTFEEGEGKTGGIMDYGDGKLNGVYQFNTRYRKGEMCKKMDKVVGRCQDKFVKASGGGGGSRPSTPTPSPTPDPSPSPTPSSRGGKGGKGGDGGDIPSPSPTPSSGRGGKGREGKGGDIPGGEVPSPSPGGTPPTRRRSGKAVLKKVRRCSGSRQ